MKRLIALLAVPLFATAALAQTDGSDGQTFGSDWSTDLGAAIFTDDTRTTLRSADELRAQWGTLSPEDQEMVRRDCAALSAGTGATTGAMPGDPNATGVSLTAAQMAELCAAVETL